MTLSQRIAALSRLGQYLQREDEYLLAVMHRSFHHNAWFTIENQQRAIEAVTRHFLQKEKLEKWASQYKVAPVNSGMVVGLVMAGNIPLVGFHDLLCVFVAGHTAQIKLSDKDPFLLPCLLQLLQKTDPATATYFHIVEKLKNYDAVIATGSNNSARYFESYFGNVPNIIRKNRNAIAVLNGSETEDDLLALGKDVFRYFGLGCRNVSKLYVPAGYDFLPLLDKLHEYREIILHHKYKNNFDYNLALLMMNREKYWNNGCILLTENASIPSRIAQLHFEEYQNLDSLRQILYEKKDQIQCVVSRQSLPGFRTVAFGKAQEPALDDYADGVDTMTFLTTAICR